MCVFSEQAPIRKSFTFLISVILGILTSTSTNALNYPQYSYDHHPFYTDPQFRGLEKAPAIMKKYYIYSGTTRRTHGVKFTPGRASYVQYKTNLPFAHNVDALYVTRSGRKEFGQTKYLEVTLNFNARVILLMAGRSLKLESLNSITGLSKNWVGLRALQTEMGGHIDVPSSNRTGGSTWVYPSVAAAVETHVSVGDELILPHPRKIKIDGKQVDQYYLLFAQPGEAGSVAKPFPYQMVPSKLIQLQTGKEIVPEPVEPNETCPDWVHDLYLTVSRDGDVAKSQEELPYWRTWHPAIDPMFWCYFSHEHGSYPGYYKPALGYTAWKTLDQTTQQRQKESNEGFKVFAVPLHEEKNYVIFVVHMHVSQSRRFGTRFHTIICAVLNEKWELELELHFKMDFGFGHGTLSKTLGRRAEPFLNEGAIRQELLEKKRLAGRRFNVLNIDEKYPASVNQSFALTCNIKPTATNKERVKIGIYEQWFGPLNTCSGMESSINRGMFFDVRDPSTGKRTANGGKDEAMQQLRGHAVDRKLMIPGGGVTIKTELCRFLVANAKLKLTVGTDGVFYTDSHFMELHPGPGNFSLRQFIKPSFKGIVLKKGSITPVDGWLGHMEYQTATDHNRRSLNVENAALQQFN